MIYLTIWKLQYFTTKLREAVMMQDQQSDEYYTKRVSEYLDDLDKRINDLLGDLV